MPRLETVCHTRYRPTKHLAYALRAPPGMPPNRRQQPTIATISNL